VKKAFVASGVRYDLAFADSEHGDEYIRELVANQRPALKSRRSTSRRAW
jgi:hypothetical protein